jgi:hypothetical protein
MLDHIEGIWSTEDWYGEVKLNDQVLDPARSQKVRNHSPDGFSWGYAGSGPSQLALAVLLAKGVPEYTAVLAHTDFCREVIAAVNDEQPLNIHIDVRAWVEAWKRKNGRLLEEA